MNSLFQYIVHLSLFLIVIVLLPCQSRGKGMDSQAYAWQPNTDTSVYLVYQDTLEVASFASFDLPVKMQPGGKISAITLGLLFPFHYLELDTFQLTGISQGFNYFVQDSLFIVAWSNIDPIEISDGGTLITLKMKSKDLTDLTGTIRLALNEGCEFADESAQVMDSVVLMAPEIILSRPDTLDTLYANYVKVYPNPIRDHAVIEFYLESDSHVKISMCNSAGEMLSPVTDAKYTEGFHQVPVSGINYSKGIYLLKFESDDGRDPWSRLVKILVIR